MPLTVENVRRMPRFHPRCGTSFMIVMMIIPILIFAFVQMDNVWLRMILRLVLLPVVVGSPTSATAGPDGMTACWAARSAGRACRCKNSRSLSRMTV